MQRLWISASKMRMYDECPKKLFFKYIEKVPELDHWYFKRGRDIEDLFVAALKEWKLILWHSTEELSAKALLENEDLMSVLRWKQVFHHREYRLIQCKDCKKWTDIWPETWDLEECSHCLSENLENYWLIGITDIEVEWVPFAIDLKTSSATWSEETVKDNKRQAKMYAFIKSVTTGEDVRETRFASVNIKTKWTSFNQLVISTFDDFRAKIDQLKLSFEMKMFPVNPSWKCWKFCPFDKFCSKKNDE